MTRLRGWRPGPNGPISSLSATRPEPSAWSPDDDRDVVRLLERYVVATELQPRPDLVERVTSRVARAPTSTAPRRFLAALSALDARHAVRALRQCGAVALMPGSTLVRAQALALVLLVVASVGVGASVSLVGASLVAAELTRPSHGDERRSPSGSSDGPAGARDPAASGRPVRWPVASQAPSEPETPDRSPDSRAGLDPERGPFGDRPKGPRADPAPNRRDQRGRPEARRTPKPRDANEPVPREPREPRAPRPTREPRETREPQARPERGHGPSSASDDRARRAGAAGS